MTSPTRREPPARRRPAGRYDLAAAREPANGIARPPRSPNVDVAIVAVPDPFSARERILAAANRRVDVLEDERSHGRISEAAYQVGRLVQAVFERGKGPRGAVAQWTQGDRVDAAFAHEHAIVLGLDDARKIKAYLERLSNAVGMIDARLLRHLLGERMSFAECAAARGRAGERGARYYASRFRDALEVLAQRWAAKGKGR
jgi:hypothetical protein